MFEQIVGHDRIQEQLSRVIEDRNPHHAYLFAGQEHVGKMSVLREFVSQLRDGKSFEEGGLLEQQIAARKGPGLISFPDDGESLKVEEVRTIADFVSRRTADDSFSFCIIEHVERMTVPAMNAFLKMLEEPSERFIFLMTTRREKKLLPTVLSRVQLLRFSTLPEKQVRQFLEKKVKNPVLVQELMELSVGRIGLALTLLKDQELLERMRRISDNAKVFLDHDLIDRFALAEHLTKKDAEPEEILQFLAYLALVLRKEGGEKWVPQLDRVQRLHRLFQDTNVNKRLFLEEMFLQFE